MAVRLIVDSASDLLPEEAARLGVVHLPMSVYFGEKEYADAVTLTHHAFYEKLVQGDEMPTTSQVSPTVFEETYEQVTANGDTAVVITMSGKLSGTYQSACIAAEGYEGKVYVVDSANVALGERILVERGLQLVAEGLTASQIKETLDAEKQSVRLFALIDTLEYLKKGGRISSTVAFAGGLLAIKPIIAVEEGAVEIVAKARGAKQGNAMLCDLIRQKGINPQKPCCLAYSGVSDEALRMFAQESAELWQACDEQPPMITVGCTIGAHVGPGAVAVAFFEKEA